jgi:hypothetical protein
MSKRLTRSAIDASNAPFNPIGHVVMAFDGDDSAREAAQALQQRGLSADDVIVYLSSEFRPRLQAMLDHTGSSAGFGYELTLMRRYLRLADEGAGWLIVYAPDDKAAEKVAEVAEQSNAQVAVRYQRLATQDLI